MPGMDGLEVLDQLKSYRDRLLKKLNLRNNIELARFAIQNRLVQP